MNDIGHNSDNATGNELKRFIERIERQHEERKDIASDIKEIYGEAKCRGFDVKAIKHIVSLRSKDANAVQEFEAIVELYKASIGMA